MWILFLILYFGIGVYCGVSLYRELSKEDSSNEEKYLGFSVFTILWIIVIPLAYISSWNEDMNISRDTSTLIRNIIDKLDGGL